MIEILFVLSIAAFLSLGAVTLYAQANRSRIVDDLISEVNTTMEIIRQQWAGQSSYGPTWGPIIPSIIHLLPANRKRADGTIRFGDNGSMGIGAMDSTYETAPNNIPHIYFVLDGVPSYACTRLVTSVVGLIRTYSVDASGSWIGNDPTTPGWRAGNLPITIRDAQTYTCRNPVPMMTIYMHVR